MATLVWPLKSSFVRYVSRVDGVVYVGEGAWVEPDGFAFAGEPDDAGGAMRFRGALVFHAHAGVLHVEIADPSLEPRHDGSWSVCAYTDQGRTARVCFAEAIESSRDDGRTICDVRLNRAGAELFGGNYSEGAALDPLIVEPADRTPRAEPSRGRTRDGSPQASPCSSASRSL